MLYLIGHNSCFVQSMTLGDPQLLYAVQILAHNHSIYQRRADVPQCRYH